MRALARAADAIARGAHPIAVLDLDLTLLENAPRTRSLLVDWARARFPGEAGLALAERARTMPLVFSIAKNLAALGVEAAAIEDGLRFWRQAFFDPARLAHDEPLPGALEATKRLREADVTVVYLTARPARLAAATVERLHALGFPAACPGAVLLTKDGESETDASYKDRALAWIGRLGAVVLCAENEPAHANAMRAAFPDALTVLVETRHSEPAPPLADGILRVADLATAL